MRGGGGGAGGVAHATEVPRLGGSPNRMEGLAVERVARAAHFGAVGGSAGGAGGVEQRAGGSCGGLRAGVAPIKGSGEGSGEGHGALRADPLRGQDRPVSSGGTGGWGWRTSVRVTLH